MVEKCVAEIEALLRPLSTEDRLLVLQRALHAEAERENINPAKLANGTTGEFLLCQKLGLAWNSDKVHGHDATDVLGRGCELKVALYKRTPGIMVNINYTLPVRKSNESRDVYLARLRVHLTDISGGHYWGVRKDTEIVYHWHIEAGAMSDYLCARVAEQLDKKPQQLKFHFNLGGKVCKNCRGIHKIDTLAQLIPQHNFEKTKKRVSINCTKT